MSSVGPPNDHEPTGNARHSVCQICGGPCSQRTTGWTPRPWVHDDQMRADHAAIPAEARS